MVTEQCIVIGIHNDKQQSGALRSSVFNLAKYLKENSY
jgi:hypothetical protein